MPEKNLLAGQFEENRNRLRAVAYRILGSRTEAEDAVQEVWLRLNRTDSDSIDNIGGWLTTVVARICLDMLRARNAKREEPLGPDVPEPAVEPQDEQDARLADSVGMALLVVLEKLSPAERVAFVLHDMFNLPFEQIAAIVERSPAATRQLASRARRRVQGVSPAQETDLDRQRDLVSAFLAASRDGDFQALLAALDPDVVLHADAATVALGSAPELRGAQAVAEAFKGRARAAQPGLVDGKIGVLVIMPNGVLRIVLRLTIVNGKISGIDAIADAERIRSFHIERF